MRLCLLTGVICIVSVLVTCYFFNFRHVIIETPGLGLGSLKRETLKAARRNGSRWIGLSVHYILSVFDLTLKQCSAVENV